MNPNSYVNLGVPVKFAHRSSTLLRAPAAIKLFPADASCKILLAFEEVRAGRDAGKPSRRARKHAAA